MGSTNLAALAVAMLVCSFSMTMAQRTCYTPERQPGKCVPINNCKAIMSLTQQRPLPYTTTQLLGRMRCGFQGNIPYVCCASRDTTYRGGENRQNSGGYNEGNSGNPAPLTNMDSHPNLRLLPRDRCGVDLSDKIINGEEAKLKEYPWLALLEYQTSQGRGFLCGGTLISERYILTAAHCVTGIKERLIGVRLGEHNTDTDPDCQSTSGGQTCGESVQTFGIAEVIFHPQFNSNDPNQQNDIALIRLDRPTRFTDYIAPICLPWDRALNKTYTGSSLIVAGWGRTRSRSSSNVKLWVKIPVMANAECAPIYSRRITLTDTQMCAGGVGRKDSCKGDSGGPLMSAENVVSSRPGAQWVVAGIVSNGPKFCGLEGRPGIYTRVGPYVKWILDSMKP